MTPQDFLPAVTILAMIVLMFMAARVARRIQRLQGARAVTAARRLAVYASHGRPYRMFIGYRQKETGLEASGMIVPRSADRGHQWLTVETADEEGVTLDNGTRVPLQGIEAFLVAYPSGRIVDAHAPFEPLPPGVHLPERTPAVDEDVIALEELSAGNEWLRVAFEPPDLPEPIEGRWGIRVTNTGPEAIRVVSFGVYDCDGDLCHLATESGAAYTAEDFLEWFDREERPWLEPGETVWDPNGFGKGGQAWAFYFETKSGDDLVAGGQVPE